MKHTPGPWKVITDGWEKLIIGTSLNHIGEIYPSKYNDIPELIQKANAHLIAVAPEMHEELVLISAELAFKQRKQSLTVAETKRLNRINTILTKADGEDK